MNNIFVKTMIGRHMAVVRIQKSLVWEGLLIEAAEFNDRIGMQRLLNMAVSNELINNDRNYRLVKGSLIRDISGSMPFDYYDGLQWWRSTGDEKFLPGFGWVDTFYKLES